MARALLGYVGNSTDQALRLEVARLRAKVNDLEAQIADLRADKHAEIDLELHRIAEAAPALA